MPSSDRPRPAARSKSHPALPSHHALRLEQIAIWGDAAAQRPRLAARAPVRHGSPATKPARSKTPTRKRPTSAPQLPIFAPPRHHPGFDLLALERCFSTAETLPTYPLRPRPPQGSLALCNSRSAEVFRKSGAYAAVAKASVRNLRRDHRVDTLARPASAPSHHPPLRIVVTRRASIALNPDPEFNVPATAPMRDRSASLAETWRPSGLVRRRSESRKKKARSLKNPLPPPPVWKHPTESIGSRERDENNFRLSNAKLPERTDHPDHSACNHWSNFRRGRKTTFLGRYSRTTGSQLPNPPKSCRRPL